MNDYSTIRLKKTELPISPKIAQDNAYSETYELRNRVNTLFDQLHKYRDGSVIGTATGSAKILFFNKVIKLQEESTLGVQTAGRSLVFLRLLQAEAMRSPWVLKLSPDIPQRVDLLYDQKMNAPTLVSLSNSTPFEFFVEKSIHVEDGYKFNTYTATERIEKSKAYRTMKRYLARLDWNCIKQGLPARFGLSVTHPVITETQFHFSLCIKLLFSATYLQGPKYTPTSLLHSTESPNLPAIFDLPEVKAVLEHRGSPNTVIISKMIGPGELVSPFETTVPPGIDWLNALLKGDRGADEDIQSGKVPIPPESQIVTLIPLLERVDDFKKIIKSIMRVCNPYDNVSFLPTSV